MGMSGTTAGLTKARNDMNAYASEVGWGLATGAFTSVGLAAPLTGRVFSLIGGATPVRVVSTGQSAYNHGLRYAKRVRDRAPQDPVGHNFPYNFDDIILRTKPIQKKNGYKIYQKPATMNGKDGVCEIGITKDGIIDHRFFRPYK